MDTNILIKQGLELAVSLDDKSKQSFYTSLKDLMQDAGKKTEKEFADALVNAINSAFSAAGKTSPFNVADIINIEGLGKKIAEQIMSGMKQGLSSATKDVSSTIKTLTAQIDELKLKKQKASKRHEQIKNYPYLSELSYKSKEFKHLKLDDDVEAQANKIMTEAYEAKEALDGLQRGSKEYNAALINAFGKTKQAIQMGKTLHDKGIKLQNVDTADFFDDPKDMMVGLIENRKYLEDLEEYIKKLEVNISKTLPQKISLLSTQLNELKVQSGDIIDNDGLKSGLKTIEEITAAYQRMAKLSPKKQEKYQHSIEEAINYKAPEGQFSVKAIADKYKESVANGDDWEIQYQWLIKFTRAYDAYSQKKFADDRVQKGILEAYRPLYDEVASQAQNAQNMLQNILNLKTNTPLVGMEAEVNANKEKAQVIDTVTESEKEQVKVEKTNNAQIHEKTNLIQQQTAAQQELNQAKISEPKSTATDDVVAHEKTTLAINKETEAQKQLNNTKQEGSDHVIGSIFDKYPNMFGAAKDKQKLNEKSADVANKEVSTQKTITTELEKQNKLLLYRVGKTSLNPDKFRNSDMMGNAIQFGNKVPINGKPSGSLIDNYGGFGDGLYMSTISSAASLTGREDDDLLGAKLPDLPDDQSYFEIDASKYNLYVNRTVEQANKVKDFLLKLQKFILAAGDFRGFDDELTGVTDEALFTEAQSIFESFNMSKQETLEWLNSMKQLVKKNGLDKNGIWTKADDKFLNSHNFGTRFMKTMGYEGVLNDTQNEDLDGYGDGSVIYDPDFESLNKHMQDTGHVWKSHPEYLTYLDAVKQKVQEGTNAYIESKKAIDNNTIAKNNNKNATKSEVGATQQATEVQQEFNKAKAKETKPQSKPVSAPVPKPEQKLEQRAVSGTLIDDGKLKGILEAITYNVKVVQDSDANSDNSLSIDEASLESVLNKVLGNITPQENQPWAREDTLNTTIKGILDKIQANTQKTKKQPAGIRSTLATEETLQNILKAIDSKTTTSGTNAKTSTQGTSKIKTDLPSVGPAPFTEKLKSRVGDLAKFKTQLVATGKLTDDVDNEIKQLLVSLEQVKNGSDFTIWSEKFKQLKTKVGIDKIWDNVDKKSFKEQIKEQRKLNNIDIANSTSNAGRKALNSLWKIDDTVDIESIEEVKKLRSELTKLATAKKIVDDKIQAGQDLSKQDIKNLQMSSDGVAEYTAKIKELIANYERLKNGEHIGDYIVGAGSDEAQLQSAINARFDGKAKIKRYERNSYGDLTAIAEVKSGARAFTEYSVAVSQADGKIKALKGTTHQMPSWLDSVKKKLREISQYFSAMSIISKAIQQLRKGIQYVKEIDLALTELKKVTDETEQTYDKFLDTASKTAAKVGSTIKEVVSSTADFARLGYSLKEAAIFAESAQILMNVSEFTDVSRATDTLISAVQAFGYTAETSMDVVDMLNMIGNNYAISTADLAQSLTKSSASLVAAGGDLAEAAALTATANAIIQDADSVGTALKTTSLRLRGTSVKVLEEEGLDSDGAIESTSKLRSQVLATSGVDILTDSGAYKSTYQILLEIAEVWDKITDDKARAGLLELLAGKRNSSVIAALLQNPEDLKAAYEDANNAQGSALKENEKYLDSIQGKLDQLTNAIQTLWKNALDDDVVKFFVDIGTSLIKILDKLGPIKVLVAAIMTYFSKKYHILDFDSIYTSLRKVADLSKGQGIKGFFKNLKGGFKDGSISVDNLRNTVSKLKDELKDLEGSTSGKDVRKRNSINGRIEEYQAEIDAYDKMIADRDAAFKQRDDAKLKLNDAELELQHAWSQGEFGEIDSSDIDKLQKKVNDAKVEFEQADIEAQQLDATVKKTGKGGVGAFKSLGKSVKNFAKQAASALIQMAAMWAIMKLLELGKELIDYLIPTPEEAAEAFEELTDKLKSTKNEIEGINSELKTLDDKIADIIAKGELTFTDKEELERLKAEREELERELALKEALAKQQQEQVNSQTSDQVQYYKDKGVKTGKTAGENVGSGAGIGAGIGATVGVASGVGGAILGVKAGAALGAWAGPIGMLIGAAIGAAAGAAIGAGIGGAIAASEPTIGEEIDNMETNLAKKKEELQKAREKYQQSGSDEDKKKYEEAQKALSDYRGEMSKYFTELGAYYDNLDLSAVEDPDQYKKLKKEMNDFYNERDKWLITSGSEGAKVNAVERIFNKKEYEDAYKEINDLQERFRDGENINMENAITGIIDKTSGLREDIEATSMSVKDVVTSFAQVAAELNFETVEGVTEQYRKGIDVLNKYNGSLNAIIATYRNTDGTIENISWGSLFDAGGQVISSQVAKALSGTSETVRANFERIAQQIHDGKITIEQGINSLGALNTIDVAKVIESQVAELNTSVFKDVGDDINGAINSFKEFSAALESTANSIELLNTAQEQMQNSGRISVKTALELMQSTDNWNELLEIEEGNIRLVDNAEEILIQTKIDLIKKNLESALATVNAQLASISATETNLTMATTIEESTNVAVQQLSGNMAYLTKIMEAYTRVAAGEDVDMDSVLASAEQAKKDALDATNYTKNAAEAIGREELEKEKAKLEAMLEMYGGIDTVDEFGDNYDYDKTPGDKGGSTTERESAWEKLLKKHQAELDALAHEKDLIQAEIDEAEARGETASEKYYERLIELEKEEQEQLKLKQKEIEGFYNTNKNSMSTEELEEYQNEWREVELAIKESTNAIIDHYNALDDINLEYIEKVADEFERVHDEIDFINSLLEDEDIVDAEGNWTEAGMAIGMSASMGMDTAAKQSRYALEQINNVKNSWAEYQKLLDKYGGKAELITEEEKKDIQDKYGFLITSENEYLEQYNHFTDQYRDGINKYKDYQNQMIEAAEERVDKVIEGIERETEAYADLIQVKQDELDAERDLYKFKKQIEDQSSSIAETQRKIAALSGSTSAEDRAELKRLQATLRDQQGDIDDSYYDHSMDAQSNALNQEQTAFEQSQQLRIEALEESLKDRDKLIADFMADVLVNADVSLGLVNELATTYGFELSPTLTAPWQTAATEATAFKTTLATESAEWQKLISEGGAITIFSNGLADKLQSPFGEQTKKKIDELKAKTAAYGDYFSSAEFTKKLSATTITTELDKIIKKWDDIRQAARDAYEEQNTYKIPINYNTGGGENNGGKTENPPKQDPPKKEEPKVKLRGLMQTSREMILGSKSFVDANTETINGVKYYRDSKTGYYYKISDLNSKRKYDGGRTTGWAIPKGTWFYTKHAQGTLGTTKDEWALTDEYGPELTMYATKDGTLSFMRAGSTVIPAELTKELMDIGAVGLNGLMKPKFDSGLNVINNAINKPEYNFNIEALVKADHIDQNSIKDVEKMVNKQLDEFARKLNYSLKSVGGR